jgi:hypothetical protein
LQYSAHDFRRDSAHYRACSFSIVKPGVKVITIEPSEDASSIKEVDGFVVNGLTHELTAAEVTAVLGEQERLPWAVLSDHGGQFKEQWKE